MSETKFTPGPWEVRTAAYLTRRMGSAVQECLPDGYIHICAPEGQWWGLASVPATSEGSGARVCWANARLIAAAPDLYAALKMARVWLDVEGKYDLIGIDMALAKAEGRDD